MAFGAEIQCSSIGQQVGVIFVIRCVYGIAELFRCREFSARKLVNPVDVAAGYIFLSVAAVINHIVGVADEDQFRFT
ncbi:hypothetical protein SDC9_84013 [bioreactor metagenome]|uniref:Uncharacterized protein n=1 Tax=bioreactor metagenome TaxID=1076179 RepID=A0A644Z9P0_9ZZZZ